MGDGAVGHVRPRRTAGRGLGSRHEEARRRRHPGGGRRVRRWSCWSRGPPWSGRRRSSPATVRRSAGRRPPPRPSDAPIDTAGTTRDDVEQSDPPAWVRVLLNVVGRCRPAGRAGRDAARRLPRRTPPAHRARPARGPRGGGDRRLRGPRRPAADRRRDGPGRRRAGAGSSRRASRATRSWSAGTGSSSRPSGRGWRAASGRRSSELALRMLDVADVDRAAVTRLLELYREARFSGHQVGEAGAGAARSTRWPGSGRAPGRSGEQPAPARVVGPRRDPRRWSSWSARSC